MPIMKVTEMSIPEIMSIIREYPTRFVLVTGGEPMLQESVHELLEELTGTRVTPCSLKRAARSRLRMSTRGCTKSSISSVRPVEWMHTTFSIMPII